MILLRLLASYLAAVVAVALALIVWGEAVSTSQVGPLTLSDFNLAALFAGVFCVPPFVAIGLPYLIVGYATLGQSHQFAFVVIGGLFGLIGGSAFGAILTMPATLSWFFPVGGVAAGVSAALVFAGLSKNTREHA